MGIIRTSVQRWRASLFFLTLALIAGMMSYFNIPKESLPEVTIPNIYVSVGFEGISPADAESQMVIPLEKQLRSIEGIKELRSTAALGYASVSLKFDAGHDMQKALSDVRERVDIAKSDLPADANEPKIIEINSSLFPVLNVILYGSIEQRALGKIAKDLKDNIEENPNVLEAKIIGNREEVIEIIVTPEKLAYYNISLPEVLDRVGSANRLIAAGVADNGTGRFAIKLPKQLNSLKSIENLVLKSDGNANVKVKDIGKVVFRLKDPLTRAKVNGNRAVVLEITKRAGKNIIETVEKIKATAKVYSDMLPPSVNIEFSQDESGRIKDMLSSLMNNVLLSIVLVFIINLIFVGTRSAILVSLAVPSSFLIGVIFVGAMGYTMNIVVMFGFILSVGLLVDGATIVVENADRRLKRGQSSADAYAGAAERMKWPVLSSIVTTLIVFIPLLFWPGTAGQFMKFIPITLMVTLTASLFMALLIIPSLGAVFKNKIKPIEKPKPWPENLTEKKKEDKKYSNFTIGYVKSLSGVLKVPGFFIIMIFLFLGVVFSLYGKNNKGVEFFPNIEPENAVVQVRARGNLSVDQKTKLMDTVYAQIKDIKGINIFYANSGEVGGQKGEPQDLIGSIFMEFDNWRYRKKADDILMEVIEATKDIKGVIVAGKKPQRGPASGKDFSLQIYNLSQTKLEKTGKQISSIAAQTEGLINVQDTAQVPKIEWKLDSNSELQSSFGVSNTLLGSYVQMLTQGLKIAEYRSSESDDKIDVLARFPKDRRSINEIERIKINTAKGNIEVSNFAKLKAQPNVSSIERYEGSRIFEISADAAPGVVSANKVKEVESLIKDKVRAGELDRGFRYRFVGEDEDRKASQVFLSSAFMIALLIMALLLIFQFNSFFAMIVIMSAVFLSTVGVLVGLILTQQPFGIVMCGVGIISLAGIVVGNNIIFLDTYKALKESGVNSHEALLRTGMQRLRPILLTAGTTIVGLMPMVLGMTIDFINLDINFGAPSAQWWKQLSTAIAGGLAFATILTLFFTPALILLADKWGLNLYGPKHRN